MWHKLLYTFPFILRKILNNNTGAANHRGERILRTIHRNLEDCAQKFRHAANQCATAGQVDSLLHNVSQYFRRGCFEYFAHGLLAACQFARKAFLREEEIAVEHLARVIAPFLPLPPSAGEPVPARRDPGPQDAPDSAQGSDVPVPGLPSRGGPFPAARASVLEWEGDDNLSRRDRDLLKADFASALADFAAALRPEAAERLADDLRAAATAARERQGGQ